MTARSRPAPTARKLHSPMPPAERWPHGVRARYVAGCRCDDCRKANREYARTRAKAKVYDRTNSLVDAALVRKHLRALSRKGVGRRAVAAASDVAVSLIQAVTRGGQLKVHESIATRLLAVTTEARGDAALVAAGPTQRRIKSMVAAGYTMADLATLLGYQRPALQLGKRKVLVSTEARVEKLYRELMGEER